MDDDPILPGLIGDGLVLRRPVTVLEAQLLNARMARCDGVMVVCDRPIAALCGALAVLREDGVGLSVSDETGAQVLFVADVRAAMLQAKL